MKKAAIYLILLSLLTIKLSGQDDTGYSFTIGTGCGTYKNINGYRLSLNNYGNDFSSDGLQGSFGIDYGWFISGRLRPRISINYLRQSYKVGWESANITTMSESIVYLYNFSTAIHSDYLIKNGSKFQLFLSPAVIWEFSSDKDVKNIRKDGTYNWYHYNDIISENPGSIFGASFSAIFKYNIRSSIGITVSPEYTLFMGRYAATNDKNYSRLGLGFGVEFNFR